MISQHTDAPGLQARARDGRWLDVPLPPRGADDDAGAAFIVNLGDALQYWTCGKLRATPHRCDKSLCKRRIAFAHSRRCTSHCACDISMMCVLFPMHISCVHVCVCVCVCG